MEWIKVEDRPLVNWSEDGKSWIESCNCPTGRFLAGLFVHNNITNTTRFDWYSVVLTDGGLMESADDDTFDIGWELEDFTHWAEVNPPTNL